MQRNSTFDIMKGIGILAVIIGHLSTLPDFYAQFLFSFHMPLFFILAGYFYRRTPDISTKLRKDAKRLLLPYLVTVLTILAYNTAFGLLKHDFSRSIELVIASCYGSGAVHLSAFLADIPAIGAIWFLLALFWCRTFYNLIDIHCKHKWITILITAIGATLLDRYVINLPFSLLPGLSAMVFYGMGEVIKLHGINKRIILVCCICWIISFTFSNISMVKCLYSFYPIDILGALGGTFCIYICAKQLKSTAAERFFSWTGRYSLLILCCHVFEMKVGWCSAFLPNELFLQLVAQVLFSLTATWILLKIPLARKLFSVQ